MRVTSSMYYNNLYSTNNSKINNELFDVNKQIASGLKIQYAKENVRTFTETMRLDNELTTIGQVKKSTQSGYKFSNQTDVVLNEFETSLERTKTLFINAANGTHSTDSLDAIAKELRGLENHFRNLANTSINGKYLFSGSAVDTKPIDSNGIYHGNDAGLDSVLGSNSKQKYNLSGAELFLGEESNTKREITTNVVNKNLLDPNKTLTTDSKIKDLMGDKDTTKENKSYFYIRGTKSDGTSFKDKITLDENDTIGDLLDKIETDFGNKLVDVSLNSNGEIVVSDKQKGSSKLDFHIVGAVDYNADYSSGTPADRANVDDIDDLQNAETNYDSATKGDYFVKEFSKSGFASAKDAESKIEGLLYDRTEFVKNGAVLSSNVPQVLKAYNTSSNPYTKLEKNAFATPSTKLSDVADAKKANGTTPETYTLDGTEFKTAGKDINGNDFDETIDLKTASTSDGSTFTLGGNTYHIYNVDGTYADADQMTHQQLMDVINMITTGTAPSSDSADAYHQAVKDSESKGETSLSYDGKIQFKDLTAPKTKAALSLYDANSDNFTKDASVMTFNNNNALTIVDPKTDFFKNLDEAITAVEDHKLYPDSSKGNVRNQGIENAIASIDKLLSHVSRSHAVVGAQSNSLNNSLERTTLLETSTITLRSQVIDTDIAEASLKLQQLNLNYQAMLSTVGKVSKLSLVNYL